MATKISFKRVLGKISKDVQKSAKKVFTKKFKAEILKMIKARTRAGAGIGDNGNKRDFDSISDGNIKNRTRYKNKLSSYTSPNKSNITATGQLVKSLRAESAGDFGISIDVSGDRSEDIDGRTPGKISTNKKLAGLLQKYHNRKFIGLTKGEKTTVRKEIKKKFREELKKARK